MKNADRSALTGDDTAKKQHRKIFILCFAAYAFSYIGRMNFSACTPSMIKQGLFDTTFGGYIATAYFICYGCGQLINGLLSNKVSPAKMISVGLFGVSLCNLIMGTLSQRYLFAVVWAFNGFFNSMLWTPVIRAFAEWLPDRTRERAGVNIAVSIPVGTICAYIIPAIILRYFSWRAVFFTCAALVFSAMLFWIFGMVSLRSYLDRLKAENQKSAPTVAGEISTPSEGGRVNTFTVFLKAALIPVIFVVLINGLLKDAVTQWTPTYLYDTFNISDYMASLFSTVLPIISIFGAYAAKWIDGKICKNEVLTCSVMFGISALSIGLLRLCGSLGAVFAAALIAVSVSAMWGANTMLLTFIPFHFRRVHLSSSVSGVLNACVYASSSLFTSLFGSVAKKSGWNSVIVIWLSAACVGIIISAAFSGVWKKRRSVYE